MIIKIKTINYHYHYCQILKIFISIIYYTIFVLFTYLLFHYFIISLFIFVIIENSNLFFLFYFKEKNILLYKILFIHN